MPTIATSGGRNSGSSTQLQLEHRETKTRQWTRGIAHVQPLNQKHVGLHNDICSFMEPESTIRKGIQLGSGGFGHVFRAVESNTGCVVALKQSRASLRLKRPLLQHEARVLKLLAGHPNIPSVYAYGRIEHFELMTMQLLHRSLEDVVQAGGPLKVEIVANVAHQMMDVLRHVHSHQLVHRDIKPSNIMLQSADSWKLCLIDFGLTRKPPGLVAPATSTTYEDSKLPSNIPARVFGTLPFASLNAHEKDSRLTFRDDLESLAYTLLWLLRGSLPWSYYTTCGTEIGRIRQVFAQKQRHTGSTLATDLPAEFGDLVDCARSLSLDEKPDYGEWKRRCEHLESTTKGNLSRSEDHVSQTFVRNSECPVEVGQLVLVKLDPAITVDGYTIQEGHESSFILDPSIDGPEWSTVYRPAVVLQVEWNERAKKHSFLAIAISRRLGSDEAGTPTQTVPITTSDSFTSSSSLHVHTEPEWPLSDSYLYVFKRPVRFYCLPSQEPVHSTWRIASSHCEALLQALTPSIDSLSKSQERQDLESPNPDIRHDARMRKWDRLDKVYARVFPLTATHLDDESVDWFSQRAWFDECVKAIRYHNLNRELWWTGAWFSSGCHPKGLDDVERMDSYYELDYSMWSPQLERRKSITLGSSNEDAGGRGDMPKGLARIIGLEKEVEISGV